MLPASGSPTYYVEDLLGTSRVITTNTGAVCYDADFYPFGGERSYTNTCTQNYKFEGKERDTETGNDDFGARYYSNRFGRWLSADWSSVPVPVPYANLTNPQTLNLYAMVTDDPESFADLDGHEQGTADECRNHPACTAEAPPIPGPFANCPPTTVFCGLLPEESQSQDSPQQAQKPQKPKPKPKQKLTFITISGGQGSKNWVIQWKLSRKSPKGGRIVQQVTLTDSAGKQVMVFWEAWQVPADSQFTTFHGIGSGIDDTWSAGILSHFNATASARFYEGLELPASFIVNNPDTPAYRLPSTTIDPHLPTSAATDPVDRTWTSPWQ
jgi:RHS repeat-associated protein